MIIYKATNKVNGKVYIGSTKRVLAERINSHHSSTRSKTKTPFHKALLEHGFTSFEWEVLEKAATLDDLSKKETHWIRKYKSTHKDYGYNVRDRSITKLLIEKPSQMINIKYPTNLLEKIEEYQEREGIPIRSQAIQELIRRGLKDANNEEQQS